MQASEWVKVHFEVKFRVDDKVRSGLSQVRTFRYKYIFQRLPQFTLVEIGVSRSGQIQTEKRKV